MAIKKSQLYSALWESCNALRGSMDASQYKDYVLIVLFIKYLSDKAGQPGFRLKVPEGCYFKDFTHSRCHRHLFIKLWGLGKISLTIKVFNLEDFTT